jgi:hypothetical protein
LPKKIKEYPSPKRETTFFCISPEKNIEIDILIYLQERKKKQKNPGHNVTLSPPQEFMSAVYLVKVCTG